MIVMPEATSEGTTTHLSFLAGGGELGDMIRGFDWARTSLGVPEHWPLSLKTAIRILLTSRQPMFVWWGSDLINIYNDPYRAILGAKHPHALGRPASEVWHEIWDQVGPRAHSTIARNQGTYDEALFLMMERSGYPEETYYTFSYSPLPNDQGETRGIFCANTDDTERIIGARRLALQRELAARTIDVRTIADACNQSASALATNLHDLPFTLLYLKPPGEHQLTLMGTSGISPGHDLAPPVIAPADSAVWSLDGVLNGTQPASVDLPGNIEIPTGAWARPPQRAILLPINPSTQIGSSAVLIAALSPHRPYDDGYRDFLSLLASQIAAALTSAQAYEDERKRAEALADLDRAKTVFFSNVSHEFRTPLTLMLGPLEDLLRRDQESLALADRETIELVQRNGLRLQKLVNALLDFSRIEAGRMLAQVQPTDLAAFTADLASTFRSAMERAGLALSVDCPPLSHVAYVDREMWEKIVLNLLSNALKYTFEGSVVIGLTEENGQIRLSVSDTGVGIPESELPLLFERFHRVEGARARTHEGTGIGLALVHELVRIHGGSISVSSSLDQGTTFTVSVPFDVANRTSPDTTGGALPDPNSLLENSYVEEALGWLPRTSDPASETPLPLPLLPVTRSPQGRILLADDNSDMRGYVQRLLAPEYEVVVTANGREALQAAIQHPPDLVLADIMMPELDGLGLLQELRANPVTRSVPVVFLSARAGEEARAEGREAGADDYIVKPFTARELLARVRGTLQIHRERRHSMEQLNQIFAQAPVAICVLSGPDFVYEMANPFYHQLVLHRQLLGRRIADVIPDLPEDVWQAFRRVVDHGETFSAKEWYIPYDANNDNEPEDHWFDLTFQPLRNSAQSIQGLIAVSHDVTLQVQARKEIERVNRELEEFAYVASHDLQEPLRMVNSYSQLLVKRIGSAPPEQIQKYADFITSGAHRMQQLIEDLLSFARTVHSGESTLEPVALASSVNQALEVLRPRIEESNARIEISQLPLVLGEEMQFVQLFQNLLSNALKYSKSDVPPHIRIYAEQSDSEWIISVADNGIGFRQEFTNHIFGLFKRLHRGEYPGTGLGLAICKRIVERHNGRIWARSEPGKGSTFSFALTGADWSANPAGHR